MTRIGADALETAVVSIAVWTVIFHCGLLLALPADLALIVWAVLTPVARRWLITGRPGQDREITRRPPLVIFVLGLLFSGGALFTHRPDADDAFYINRASYVEHRGTFPTRDTVFSDQGFPSLNAADQLTSYEALVGALARPLPVSAPTLFYLIVGPGAAFLGILAFWRLARAAARPAPAFASVVAATFLWLDGANHASFGNFAFVRSWQGKAVLLTLLVPCILTLGLDLGRTPSARRFWLLVAGAIAGTGLTASAALLVPPLVVVGILAGTGSSWSQVAPIARWVPLAFAYPVVLGLGANRLLEPNRLLAATPYDAFDLWRHVLGRGELGVLLMVTVVIAAVATRNSRTRRLVAGGLVAAGLVLNPLSLRLLSEASAGGAVLWRAVWLVPVPLAVATLVTLPLERGSSLRYRGQTVVLFAVLIGLLLGFSDPVTARSNGVWVGRPAWDWPLEAVSAAAHLRSLAGRDNFVAAPLPVEQALALHGDGPRGITVRADYVEIVAALGGEAFRGPDRAIVTGAIEGAQSHTPVEVVQALARLNVRALCLPSLPADRLGSALVSAGFQQVARDGQCAYWTSRGGPRS